MSASPEPVFLIYVRDKEAIEEGKRYGCRRLQSGVEPLDRSIGEWEHLFSVGECLTVAPRIREALAAYKAKENAPGGQEPASAPDKDPEDVEEEDDEGKPKKKKSPKESAILLGLASEIGDIYAFRDQRGDPYVRVTMNGTPFIVRLSKKDPGEFGDILTKMSLDYGNYIPKESAIKEVVRALRAEALHGENVHPLFNRVAEYDGSFMYYLSDQGRRVIAINPKIPNGWHILGDAPILFKHYPHMLPQDEPKVSDGTYLDKFVDSLNLSKDGKLMHKINLATDLIPEIAHAGMSFDGPNGSTKSTLIWAEKMLIDPSSIDLMPPFKDRKELHRAMDRHYIMPIDNVSHITLDMSDDLARGITGITIPTRGLYTDDDDFIRKFKCIVRLNGISQEVKQSDLLSRLLLESVPELDKSKMRNESDVKAEILAWRPYILGELLTIVSKAMTIKPTLKVTAKPRMSDWYTWAMAVSVAMGIKQEDFVKLYDGYEEKQHSEAVNQSMIAPLIKEASRETLSMDCCTGFYGTNEELLKWLVNRAKDLSLKTKTVEWPEDPSTLGKMLKRLRKDLRTQDVEVVLEYRHEQLTKISCFENDPKIKSRHYSRKDRIKVILSTADYKEIFGGTGAGTVEHVNRLDPFQEPDTSLEQQEQENSNSA